jgi:arabinosaccharide transport system permease protein
MNTLYRQKKHGNLKVQGGVYTFLGMSFFSILCALVVIPVVVFLIASFKPGQDLIRNGLSLSIDPDRMTIKNYQFLFTGKHSYFMWFKNSLLLTVVQVTLSLFVCYIVAYGLAMYVFRLRNILFFLVIATMMVPFEILMLPLYVEVTALKLINSLAGVILPGLCGAGTIFFFRQYMLGLPKDLLDAGRIDGANEYRICFTIMLPLAKPAFAAMGILSAMGSWNSMLWPLLVFRDASKFTLPIGLNTLLTPYGNDYDLLVAGSVFSVIPVFILFLLFQKYFIGGMTAGAVKG